MPADPALIPEILRRWGGGQRTRIEGAFSVGGHQLHGGAPWAPLAPSTIRAKGHPTILVRTGRLANSIFMKVSGTVCLLGSKDVRYAIYHQNGTSRMPQRKVAEVSKSDIQDLKLDLKRTLES